MTDWFRWCAVFSLIALGLVLVNGLDFISKSPTPVETFSGLLLAYISVLLLPGVILGGIIGLAAKRSTLGLKIMVGTNTIISVLTISGFLIQIFSAK